MFVWLLFWLMRDRGSFLAEVGSDQPLRSSRRSTGLAQEQGAPAGKGIDSLSHPFVQSGDRCKVDPCKLL